MAFIRMCIFIILSNISLPASYAQPVYYPAQASTLLKSTAQDVALLFQKAINNSTFSPQQYVAMPLAGIIFVYDSSITDNQACHVESNGTSFIKFSAAQDNGLVFGIYQYLDELGFRFYQPGSIWETTPVLYNPYKPINKNYSNIFKYRNWFISGGHNRWAMDNNNTYGWDIYFGENGHQWALYQRRNGMQGAYRFNGHRGDIMTGSYMASLQNNPCFVASYNGSRQATTQSVPDVNNTEAMNRWSNAIEQNYTNYKNIIFGNQLLYTDLYRNFDYGNKYIGIEVPDGPQWGNSTDSSGCSTIGYTSASDQSTKLSDHTARKINTTYPGKRFQVYAYAAHADISSSGAGINSNIDIQVISTAFQTETTSKGLLNRWYNRTNNISEYHYLNIPQWGGETPMYFLKELKNTLNRLAQKHSQGIVWEASPAKFASLPFLWAANKNLLTSTPVDSSLKEFTNAMFGAASPEIYALLLQWSDDNTVTTGGFIADNKYKVPLYLQMLHAADIKTQNSLPVIKQRINELKAYLHYMVLYYDFYSDQRANNEKITKAAALCMYLAKINKLQIVNSYFLISDIVNKYVPGGEFYNSYNVYSGTAYQNGSLPLITNTQIENDYVSDYNNTARTIEKYEIKDPSFISERIESNNMSALQTINIKVGYTNGLNYSNQATFFILAKNAGDFIINYTPVFNMPGKGNINFTVEEYNKPLEILKDFTLVNNAAAGKLTISLPAAGTYKLTITSKFQSSVDLIINTNGNLFYKNTPFLGNKTENYRSDLSSLPGYFYVPEGLKNVYFSIHNAYSGGHFASAGQINNAFLFRDNLGNNVQAQFAGTNDSSLFYILIPDAQSGSFWQVFKMEQYDLCFANTSNVQWYLRL